MLDCFSRYPSLKIEDIGMPMMEKLDTGNIAEFDYIIVGGGTAGCVLANRLSANPIVKVLLIERGQINNSLIASSIILSFPHVGIVPSKGIKTTPQRHLDNREDVLYESLSLGGRTRINAALYLPGCPAEYDSWGEGWQWKDVGSIFARSEGCLDRNARPSSAGEGGEWKTRTVKAEFESSRQYATGSFYANGEDPDAPTCFGTCQRRIINSSGRRCSTYHAFLPESLVRKRRNLTIVLGSHVQQILLSNDVNNLRATELVVEGKDGRLFTVHAKHEIIVSAGAIVTPQLFLLSGIGPKEHLSEVGKTCIIDLPGVGSTLQDHLYVTISFWVPIRDSIHRYLASPLLALLSLLQFFIFGTGVFLSIVSEYFCYLHTQKLPPKHDTTSRALPDMELIWTAAYGSLNFPKFPSGKGGASVMIQNSTPKSVGTVRLTREGANDIKVDPIVDPNYLSAKEDWDVYRRGLVFAREIGAEMARSGYAIEEADVPASNSLEDLDAYIRKSAYAGQHLLSSCRMKPLEEGGVVGRDLKVYGIEGLRVADGSVVPSMVASRPQATIVMIAERCADFIRQGWKEQGLFMQ